MKKSVNKIKKKNVFSKAHILIYLSLIVLIFLGINYFYPLSSYNNSNLDQTNNPGNLNTIAKDRSEETGDCGGDTCGTCERCVISPKDYKPACLYDWDDPVCGSPDGNCGGFECGKCTRCILSPTTNHPTCARDWEGECKDACGGCHVICEDCIKKQDGTSSCKPKENIHNIKCPDGSSCLLVNDNGETSATCKDLECKKDCGECAYCSREGEGIEVCKPFVDNTYSCDKKPGSNDGKGMCINGKCQ